MKEAPSVRQTLLWGLLALVVAGIGGIGIWAWKGARIRDGRETERLLEGLEVFGSVPDFSLIERSGRRVRLSDLTGKIWIANFFYTNCRDTCPLVVPQMGLLQVDFKDETDIRWLSITVDPERDTPKVLTRYAERFRADPERWLFLTGEKAAIYHLAQEGFRLGVGEVENPPDILHSSRLVLVDRGGRIRGYYSGIDVEAMVRLRRDVKRLLRTGGG